ncbi:hypothetical protein SAMD00023353_0902320 [Rosellinia necatrix]|uniref:Uncharacterized protein n=1 Tax=Rosellinia necatrix TaxID=77044 RepID=A0A1S8A6Q7_ROSNE|nr:hypothetical protein SAMD00023353_0902320 [Rosellinia necatrix]
MPLLYGEGEKALSRLQVEILAAIEDDTIFLGGLTSTDHDLGEWPHTALEHLTMEQDFLATPENIFAEFPTMVRPLPNITGSLHAATQVMSQSNPYINSSGRVQRDEPRKDPKLRGDVLSMPMRVIQVLFSDRPPARTPITQKKQFRVQITPTSQSILEAFGSNSVNSNNASLCLGLLRCGKDDRLIARYFMCLLVNDELYAFPTPFYRFVSPPEASYWPYIECHILLDKGVWKPTPYLTHLRDPAGWNLPAAKPNTNFGNGWTWSTWGKEEQGVNTNMAFQISNETILSYRLCFDEGNEIWNLTLTLGSDDTDSFGRTKAVKVEIRLQCVTSPGLDAEVMTASHRRREGPVTELCKRMRTSGGSAELVVSVYYGVESGQHYYSPMIRFRAFEARNLGRK